MERSLGAHNDTAAYSRDDKRLVDQDGKRPHSLTCQRERGIDGCRLSMEESTPRAGKFNLLGTGTSLVGMSGGGTPRDKNFSNGNIVLGPKRRKPRLNQEIAPAPDDGDEETYDVESQDGDGDQRQHTDREDKYIS